MNQYRIIVEAMEKAGYPLSDMQEVLLAGSFAVLQQAAVLAEREACAKVCDEIAVKEWDAYKGRTEPIDKDKLYNPHIEGISDGADECAAAIRARGE